MSSFPFRSLLFVLASSVLSCSNQSSDEIPLLLSTPKGSVDTYGLLARVDSLVEQAWYSSAMAAYTGLKDLYEQEANWPGYIRAKTGIGRIHSKNGHYDQAQEILQTTVNESSIFLPANSLDYGGALSELGRVYVRLGRFDEAEHTLNLALRVGNESMVDNQTRMGKLYHDFGLLFQEKGDYDRAHENYEEALVRFAEDKTASHRLVAKTLNNIGNLYWKKGLIRKALDMHENTLSLKESFLPAIHPSIAITLSNIGNQYLELSDYENALGYYKRALAIQSINGSKNSIFLSYTHHNLGVVFRRLDSLNVAEHYLLKALSLKSDRIGASHPSTANTYLELGKLFTEQSRNEEALEHLQRSRTIFMQTGHPNLANSLHSLAIAHTKSGNVDSLKYYFAAALHEMETSFQSHHPLTAQIRNDFAKWLLDGRLYRQALEQAQAALKANVLGFTSFDVRINPPTEESLSDIELIRSLNIKARCWLGLAEDDSFEDFNLNAIENLDRAGRVLNRIRIHASSDESKHRFAAERSNLFFDAILTSLRLFHRSSHDRFLRMAFRFSEGRKDQLSLDFVMNQDLKSSAGVSAELIRKSNDIRLQISELDRRFSEKRRSSRSTSDAIDSIQRELHKARQEFGRLERLTQFSFPQYSSPMTLSRTISVTSIQDRILDSNTALIEYVLEPDTLIIFVVTDDTLAGVGVSIPPNLDQVVDSLKWGITRGYAEWYLKYGHYLHELLLSPVESVIRSKDLIIVPEGILNYVPFEALLTKPFNGSYNRANFRDLPYVIKDRAVSYAYSSTLLHHSMTRVRDEPTKDFFAVAPVFEQDLELDSKARRFLSFNGIDTTASYGIVQFLPGTRDEVLGIEQMFKASAGLLGQFVYNKSEVLIEKEATEAALKAAQLGDYRYVHFATHSFVNERDGKLSGMLLLPDHTGRNDSEDGVLYSDETYSLDLNADLVVLSACETGIGNIAIGEGITGFSRGFIIAGAKNLVVSLWPSDDAGTKFLMLEFYYNILKGESIKNALRLAKLELIDRGGIIAKPYFWSPFIQIGA